MPYSTWVRIEGAIPVVPDLATNLTATGLAINGDGWGHRIVGAKYGDWEGLDKYEPTFVADSNGFGYCSSQSTSAPRFGSLSLTLARDLTHIGLGI